MLQQPGALARQLAPAASALAARLAPAAAAGLHRAAAAAQEAAPQRMEEVVEAVREVMGEDSAVGPPPPPPLPAAALSFNDPKEAFKASSLRLGLVNPSVLSVQ